MTHSLPCQEVSEENQEKIHAERRMNDETKLLLGLRLKQIL